MSEESRYGFGHDSVSAEQLAAFQIEYIVRAAKLGQSVKNSVLILSVSDTLTTSYLTN